MLAPAHRNPPTFTRDAKVISFHRFFGNQADVVNRGFGGYNSRWARPVLDQVRHCARFV
jgi:hypothetical protein